MGGQANGGDAMGLPQATLTARAVPFSSRLSRVDVDRSDLPGLVGRRRKATHAAALTSMIPRNDAVVGVRLVNDGAREGVNSCDDS